MPGTRWIAPIVALTLLACADRREPLAREHLREKAASGSGGALTLTTMTKTNGFDHEREGMKLHTIEWEATLHIHRDGWTAGWQEFQVLPSPPNALAAAVEGASVKRVLRGGRAVLQGKSELQKADRGWRVLQSEVSAFKILPPPDVPNEGRSTDIRAFFDAFKVAAASKNTETLSKFVRFPCKWGDQTIGEVNFRSGAFPFSDEQRAAIQKAQMPSKHPDGWYGLYSDHFALFFDKDQDGYWKLDRMSFPEEVEFQEGPEGEL